MIDDDLKIINQTNEKQSNFTQSNDQVSIVKNTNSSEFNYLIPVSINFY